MLILLCIFSYHFSRGMYARQIAVSIPLTPLAAATMIPAAENFAPMFRAYRDNITPPYCRVLFG